MKITVKRDAFRDAWKFVSKAVPARAPKPILQNVRLFAGRDSYMIGTDLMCSLRADIANCIEVVTPGDVLIPAARFGQILDDCRDETMTLEVKGDKLIVTGNRSKFTLPTESANDFPNPSFDCTGGKATTLGRAFASAIARTTFACDDEASRYELGGVLIEPGEPGEKLVRFVATNGRQMVSQEVPVEQEGWSTTEFVIAPEANLRVVRSLCEAEDGMVEFWADASNLYVETSKAVASVRLLEGRFPSRKRAMVRAAGGIEIEVPVSHLLACVKQASVVCDREESRGIEWTAEDGTLRFSSVSAFAGESLVEMPIGVHGSAGVRLDFRYSVGHLSTLSGVESVRVQLVDENKPAYFSTSDGNAYVLMPMCDRKAESNGGAK